MSGPSLFVDIASRSEKGGRSANEDQVYCGRAAPGWFAVLADGAGGHSRGAEASRRAVQCIADRLTPQQDEVTPELLTALVDGAHAELRQHQSGNGPRSDMHTTLVLLWIDSDGRHALWSHVGDSRLYRLRRGVVDMVTRDDSVVQHMVTAGLITPEQARDHPQKNQLVAALGIDGPLTPHTVARPVELYDGDAFLLCSDGWWDGLDPLVLAQTLAQAQSPEQWLDHMQRLIEARQVPRQDNFSAVAVWIGQPSAGLLRASEDTLPRKG